MHVFLTRGAKAAIVCFDLTDDTSWERARYWVQEVTGHEENCRIYLCGTKRDLIETNGRAMDYHDITDYADLINASVFETSSKTGENITELFDEIASDYLRSDPELPPEDADKICLSSSASARPPDDPWHRQFTSLCC